MSSIDDWNPMEQEYLSSRNDYNVNDEDVGSALLKQGEETQTTFAKKWLYTSY